MLVGEGTNPHVLRTLAPEASASAIPPLAGEHVIFALITTDLERLRNNLESGVFSIQRWSEMDVVARQQILHAASVRAVATGIDRRTHR